MDLNIIIIILLFIVIISLMLVYYKLCYRSLNMEHLTTQSDEAIQNVASLYNTDKLTIGNLTVTNGISTGSLNLLPTGIIVAWVGSTVPSGWAICDGTLGTPNLAERFILGTVGANLTLPKTGGSFTTSLNSSNIPAHSHNITLPQGDQRWGQSSASGTNTLWGDSLNPARGFTTDNCGACQGQAFSVTNPYYRLAYIMKL